jgi:hypothetical protein
MLPWRLHPDSVDPNQKTAAAFKMKHANRIAQNVEVADPHTPFVRNG